MTTESVAGNTSGNPDAAGWPGDDDIIDTPQELERFPALRDRLESCGPVVRYFNSVDPVASRQLWWHRFNAIAAAGFGASAVLVAAGTLVWVAYRAELQDLAEVQESHHLTHDSGGVPSHAETPGHVNTSIHNGSREHSDAHHVGKLTWAILEFCCAVIALFAVAIGLRAEVDKRWRLLRLKSELSRFAKFNFLLNGGRLLVQGEYGAEEIDFESFTQDLERLTSSDPKNWVRRDPWATPGLRLTLARATSCEVLPELIEYYRQKRILYQIDYFRGEERARGGKDHFAKHLSEYCFFISVALAGVHFLTEILHYSKVIHGEFAETAAISISYGCLFLAIALPVVGAAIRTWRLAHEFGRNSNRFHSMVQQLSDLDDQLKNAQTDEQRLDTLWQVEYALESEHRSWLRLMVDAEWFG